MARDGEHDACADAIAVDAATQFIEEEAVEETKRLSSEDGPPLETQLGLQ